MSSLKRDWQGDPKEHPNHESWTMGIGSNFLKEDSEDSWHFRVLGMFETFSCLLIYFLFLL